MTMADDGNQMHQGQPKPSERRPLEAGGGAAGESGAGVQKRNAGATVLGG